MAKAFQKSQPAPRLLTKEEACHYLGISEGSFDLWMNKGIVPGSVPGTKRWDKKAIDTKLDKLSGLSSGDDRTKSTHSDKPANDDEDDDWEDVDYEV